MPTQVRTGNTITYDSGWTNLSPSVLAANDANETHAHVYETHEAFTIANFGFTIPDGSYINSVTVYCDYHFSGTPDSFTVEKTIDNPTVAQLNSSSWGVTVGATCAGESIVYVDQIEVTADYTEVTPTLATVTTASISGITHNSANGGGNVTHDGYATVTARGVCWNTTGTPTIANDHTHDGTGEGAFTSTLATLLASTGYHVRAYATNSVGTAYGSEVDFSTTAAPTYTMQGATGRITVWNYALTAAQALEAYQAGQVLFDRDAYKGTVTLKDKVMTRAGTLVSATHIRAGWWIQNIESNAPRPLLITGHSVDFANDKNALTIGKDWMEEEIGVRLAELLAIPPTPELEPEDTTEDNPMTDPGNIPEPPRPVIPTPAPITPTPTPISPSAPSAPTQGTHLSPAKVAARKAAYRRWLNQLPKNSPLTATERTYSAWWARYKAKHPNSDLI